MERKQYFIPRKVNESFRFLGLKVKHIAILAPIAIANIIMIITTSLPAPAKIFIAVFTVGPVYMGFAMMLDNGLYVYEYAKFFFRYHLLDQNEYSLLSSTSRRKDEPRHTIVYDRPGKRMKTPFILEGPEPVDVEDPLDKEEAHMLNRMKQWIAKPKNLTGRK